MAEQLKSYFDLPQQVPDEIFFMDEKHVMDGGRIHYTCTQTCPHNTGSCGYNFEPFPTDSILRKLATITQETFRQGADREDLLVCPQGQVTLYFKAFLRGRVGRRKVVVNASIQGEDGPENKKEWDNIFVISQSRIDNLNFPE